MDRRKFIPAALTASLVAPYAAARTFSNKNDDNHEIYELRTYELAGNQAALVSFLKNVEAPYLKNHGATHFMMFSEFGQPLPVKIRVLAAYPDFASYQKTIANRSQDEFVAQASTYTEAGQTYNRISTSLLYAFKGLKQMKSPIDNAGLFELRTYEGVNEDAVRRKIKMFNDEELELFDKVDLNPIFFGQMVAGPYMPSLVYMLNYRDMQHRDQAWQNFLEHPDWLVMRDKQVYANTVSNIRRVFLEQM